MPAGTWVWQGYDNGEWPPAGHVSSFVQLQRSTQAQNWQSHHDKEVKAQRSAFWADQHPGYKEWMVPYHCPPWVCTKATCKAVNKTGKPKPHSDSPTGYQCRLCTEARPKATTLWAQEVNGGPGVAKQKQLDKQLLKTGNTNKPPTTPNAKVVPAEEDAKPLSATAKKKAKQLAPSEFSVPRNVVDILGDLGELPKPMVVEIDGDSDFEDVAPLMHGLGDMDSSESVPEQDYLTALEEATAMIASTLKSLGKERPGVTKAAEALINQVHVQQKAEAEAAQEAAAPAEAKPAKPSDISSKLAVLQAEKAATFKRLEDTRQKRDSQLANKDEAIRKMHEERLAIVTSYTTEMGALKELMDRLEEGARKLEAQLLTFHAPSTPKFATDEASHATTNRWSATATKPLETLCCEAGFQSFNELVTMMAQQDVSLARESFFSYIRGMTATNEGTGDKRCGEYGSAAGSSRGRARRSRSPPSAMLVPMLQATNATSQKNALHNAGGTMVLINPHIQPPAPAVPDQWDDLQWSADLGHDAF